MSLDMILWITCQWMESWEKKSRGPFFGKLYRPLVSVSKYYVSYAKLMYFRICSPKSCCPSGHQIGEHPLRSRHWYICPIRASEEAHTCITAHAKLLDFGFSTFFMDSKTLSTNCGSPCYASPEIYDNRPYKGPEIDIWSLGVSFFRHDIPFIDSRITDMPFWNAHWESTLWWSEF